MPVSKLDTINVLDPKFIPETIQDVLEIKRAELIAELRQSLADEDRVSTGALQQSIDVNYSPSKKGFLFTLVMDDYWKFVDKGVDGTLKSVGSEFKFKKKNINQEAAKSFIRARGITQWKNKIGQVIFDVNKKPKRRDKSLKAFSRASERTLKKQTRADRFNTLAWLAGRAISRYGIEPTHFYTNVVDEDYEKRFIDDTVNRIVQLGNNG